MNPSETPETPETPAPQPGRLARLLRGLGGWVGRHRRGLLALLLIGGPLATLVWLWRPLGVFHGPIYGLFLTEILWVPALIATLLTLAICLLAKRLLTGSWLQLTGASRYYRSLVIWPFWTAFLVGVATFLVCAVGVGGWRGSAIYHQARWIETDARGLQTCAVRVSPWEVYDNRANSQFTESREQLTGQHLVWDPRGGFQVTFERAPRGFMNTLKRTTRGEAFMAVENTSPRLQVPGPNRPWKVGISNRWSDALNWQLRKHRYLVGVDETVMMRTPAGEGVAVSPYVEYRGMLRVPHAAGVFLLHADGRLQDLSLSQARRIDWLAGSGHLLSERQARRIQGAYVWKRGIINNSPLGARQDVIKLSDVGTDNTQPYLASVCGKGPVWTSIASPQGRANAVAAVFLTSTQEEKTWVVRPGKGVLWISDDRAVQVVKSRPYPGVQWTAGNYAAVEPRPIFVRGRLQYLVSIIPDSGINVTKSVIVDGQDADVVAVFNHDTDRAAADRALLAYLRRGVLSEDDPAVSAGPARSDSAPTAPREQNSDRALLRRLLEENERQRQVLQELLRRQGR